MTTEIENQRKNQYFWLDLFSKAQSDACGGLRQR